MKGSATLSKEYHTNELFRDFINSDNPSFLSEKYKDLMEGNVPKEDRGAVMRDVVKLVGFFVNIPERLFIVDGIKDMFRERLGYRSV